jgi:hypothetical protein
MEQKKQPVQYYHKSSCDHLDKGNLPRELVLAQQHIQAHANGNPKIDNNIVRGYN